MHQTDGTHTHHMSQAYLGIWLLPVTGFTPQLAGNLGYLANTGRADGMPHG